MKPTAEQILVKKLIKGDEKAFKAFFDEYFPRVFRFACSRFAGDEDLAEEATQGALSLAMRKIDTFRGESNLFTWLCTFCRHEIYAIRKREGIFARHTSISDSPVAEGLSSEDLNNTNCDDPLLDYQRYQLAKLVHQAKDCLPETYSNVLELKYLNGDSVKEIAKKMGSQPKATESLLTRARLAFKRAFIIQVNNDQAEF